jgi:hypothetical protein
VWSVGSSVGSSVGWSVGASVGGSVKNLPADLVVGELNVVVQKGDVTVNCLDENRKSSMATASSFSVPQ